MNTIINPHIIAEIGSNHNGDLQTAKKLIDVASDAGADSVKFQIINTEGLYLPGNYEFGHYDINYVRELREKTKFTDGEYRQLAEYALQKSIIFSASVFDSASLELLISLNAPFIKIASTDLNNVVFLRKVAKKGKPMIISTGMSDLAEIKHTVLELEKTGFNNITLMHCVSAYPSKTEDMNLGFMDKLKMEFGYPVSLSDHTKSSIAAILAITKGAAYIEKHITLDCNQEGLDHKHAAEPDVFRQYVSDIRAAVKALQPAKEKLKEDELYVKKRARRSVYASRNICAGETISENDLLIVRPSSILTADEADLVIGKKAKRNINQYEPFAFDMIEG
jgi:sialic acid synthase SpsE